MNIFYTPNIINEKSYTLEESESKHAIRVLRLKIGSNITLVDGKGNYFDAQIVNDNLKKCEVLIIKKYTENNKKPILHIAIAPTKNNDRTEWFIEKCTEIGISEITPIICNHSERKNIKKERLVKTAIAAMKQSLKATLPVINPSSSFNEVVSSNFSGNKYIAHCYNLNQKHFNHTYTKGKDCLILIGPEGDFSEDEIKTAISNGFEPITLGESRLRTETAGMVVCTAFNLINE